MLHFRHGTHRSHSQVERARGRTPATRRVASLFIRLDRARRCPLGFRRRSVFRPRARQAQPVQADGREGSRCRNSRPQDRHYDTRQSAPGVEGADRGLGTTSILTTKQTATPRLPRRWAVERDIPWRKVAGIGNMLRHEYERTAPEVLWGVAYEDLPPFEKVGREELARESGQKS
jgi:hypothetical protein